MWLSKFPPTRIRHTTRMGVVGSAIGVIERSMRAARPSTYPPNAYLDSSGYGWECERGYQTVGEACVAVNVPENAHLDYSGTGWNCNRPYIRELDRCALP